MKTVEFVLIDFGNYIKITYIFVNNEINNSENCVLFVMVKRKGLNGSVEEQVVNARQESLKLDSFRVIFANLDG